MLTVTAKFNGGVYCLEQRFLVDSGNDEVTLVDGFGAFGAGADADGWERMAHTCEEAAFFRECTAIADYSKGIHLKTVVVVEAERFVLDDTWVELET